MLRKDTVYELKKYWSPTQTSSSGNIEGVGQELNLRINNRTRLSAGEAAKCNVKYQLKKRSLTNNNVF